MDEDLKKKIEYLKEQLSNQEKLASLGLLSAGIAHEIQNPLNFVINFSKLSAKLLKDMSDVLDEIREDLPDDTKEEVDDIMSDLQCNIGKIQENGERASSIVRGVLLYSRGNDEFIPTGLQKIIKEYIWLSYHSIRANNKNFNITIKESYEEVQNVKVIPQDISRAVLNIMNNACYAVYCRSIHASTHYVPTVQVRLWHEDNWVKLSIEDNGTGISGDILPNLFQPFFTTKPVGEGTGLGLSITRSIIEEKHHGKIEVETQPGEFTRFTISLPTTKEQG
ncbi:MAG: HAMP domain-containing histidine kinase [Tannerellaceae bacterium]|nr:HAMP domain-containing histidine kinase [Tannerellaceae bacterium]